MLKRFSRVWVIAGLALLALLLLSGILLWTYSHRGTSVAAAPATSPLILAQIVGQATAKITNGTNFVVTGQVKNLDKAQHDVYVQATLKDASGQIVGVAKGMADNIPAGQTQNYSIQGTVTQPTWATVTVIITKISENVSGQGSD